ncbi:MAG: hypothetical protein RJA38_996, partial [Bacteroidota bacterium]
FVEDPRNASCPREAIRPREAFAKPPPREKGQAKTIL